MGVYTLLNVYILMRIFTSILLYSIFSLSLFSCKEPSSNNTSLEPIVDWEHAQDYYHQGISQAILYLDSLSKISSSDAMAKVYFKKARTAFKQGEPYASYLNPEVGHRANGPALPTVTDDTQRILNPIGFQKLEESIYEGGITDADYKYELNLTIGLLNVLEKSISKRSLNPQRFFIATHQQLLRIISMGITGFDTPISQLGLEETKKSLNNLWEVYDLSLRKLVQQNEMQLDKQFNEEILKAIDFIHKNEDFDTFDRFTFIKDYMNPITRSWVAIRKVSNLWKPTNDQPFNYDAITFFENDSFNADYFKPVNNRNSSQPQVDLGKKLFYDQNLSKIGNMACATCHIPEKGYSDGLVVNLNNQGNPLKRNTPTLLNSVYQKGFFWDGRAENINAQISGVFNNEEEFNSAVHEFSDHILKDSAYQVLFSKVYGNKKLSNKEVIKSLSAYIATLNGFNSKFDRNIRDEENTFTKEEKLGVNLFMGKALCATCHFMPLTNGTVPPFFNDTEKEVIGVPDSDANKKLDDDLGYYFRNKLEVQKGMFKTPTVRNIEITAPYMHNGIYATLDQVLDFYNKGGGAGLGFNLPHQTLPFDELKLTNEEQKAIIAFMNTLTDDNTEKP